MRLDQALAGVLTEVSRSQIQRWIDEGRLLLSGSVPSQKLRLKGCETIDLSADGINASIDNKPQRIPLEILYQDAHIIVINKPAGLVVHPGAGNPDGTLVNGLLHLDPNLSQLPRAGVVHRLDKDTSGLLVVARTEVARLNLIEQLAERSVKREYLAVVNGRLIAGGTVDAAIGRSIGDRRRMNVTDGGKSAVSHYRVEERFRAHTLLRVTLETGRTHQIRVHMAHIRHPIVGDPVYGGRQHTPKGATPELIAALRAFSRQALHATHLGLLHPATDEYMEWEVPMPEDMQQLIETLRADAKEQSAR
jgi:23S rRNA pseudouridine1911/1915/1917 synthase